MFSSTHFQELIFFRAIKFTDIYFLFRQYNPLMVNAPHGLLPNRDLKQDPLSLNPSSIIQSLGQVESTFTSATSILEIVSNENIKSLKTHLLSYYNHYIFD